MESVTLELKNQKTMKKHIILSLILICFQLNVISQIIPSSCEAGDDTIAHFIPLASRLTIKHLNEIDSPDALLINTPEAQVDSVLDALIAVFNAVALPGYDSIRAGNTRKPDLNHYVILCDTSAQWVKYWSIGELMTGDPNMDELLISLEFVLIDFEYNQTYEGAFIEFYTEKIFNVYAACDQFLNYLEISMAYTYDQNAAFESTGLQYKTKDGIRKLTYSYGWGDCLAGCTNWKHWNINVYGDCSVELIGHDPPDIAGIHENNRLSSVSIFPNPFNTSTTIEYYLNQPSQVTISIFNYFGELVNMIEVNGQQGNRKVLWNSEGLPSGVYYYRLQAGEQILSGKLIIIE